MTQKVKLLPVLLNGKPYQIDPTGQFAINTDGLAVRLADKEVSNSRFR